MSGEYCEDVYKSMRINISSIHTLYKSKPPLVIPATKWGQESHIDPAWCAVARIDIMQFYNILRVKQYPQICKYQVSDSEAGPMTFRPSERDKTIRMIPQYCAKNTDNSMGVPLDLLATKGMYMWA